MTWSLPINPSFERCNGTDILLILESLDGYTTTVGAAIVEGFELKWDVNTAANVLNLVANVDIIELGID